MKLDTQVKQIFAAIWAVLEILVFGGLLFGWGSLVYVLKKERVYSNLCDFENSGINNNSIGNVTYWNLSVNNARQHIFVNNTGLDGTESYNTSLKNVSAADAGDDTDITSSCVQQDKLFNLGFAVTTALFTYGNLAASQINYKFGTRVTRLIFIGMFYVGAIMLAFVSADIPWLVFPGTLFVGVAGITLMFTNVQVAYLFSRGRSVLVALMSGALDTSVLTQLCVKFAYEGGVSILYSYIFIAVANSVTLISTFVWLPKGFLGNEEETKDKVELKALNTTENGNRPPVENGELIHKEEDKEAINDVAKEPEQKSLRSYILCSTYLFHVFWFSILQLRFYFYIGSLNRWLVNISKDDTEVSHLTNLSIYAMLGGIPASFIAGALYDCEKRRRQKHQGLQSTLGPPIIPLSAATSFGIILSSLQLIQDKAATYAVFVVLTFFRAFLYSIAGGYLSNLFPSSHFGLLFGIMMSAGGTVGFLQYALFSWMEAYKNATKHVNIFLICLVALTFIHPLYLWIRCKKTGKKDISKQEVIT